MIYGVDLSVWNENVDFDELKKYADFVILRVGTIGNRNNHELDSKFKRNYKEAKSKGLLVGGYVYSYCESKEALESGAKFILSNLETEEFDLPLYLDLEDEQIGYIDPDTQTSNALEFCNYIEENSDLKGGIYANANWFQNHLNINTLIRYDLPLWIANWNNDPYTYENSIYEIMQYSVGEIDGLEGDFDKNVLYRMPDGSEIPSNNEEIVGTDDLNVPYRYYNGSTSEKVYADTDLAQQIGFLNPFEICGCLGVKNNRAIVIYNVDTNGNTKIGFCSWLGGIKNE